MRAWTTGMSEVLKEKTCTSPMSRGRLARAWSSFSRTSMRTTSSSRPQSNSIWISQASALEFERRRLTSGSVAKASSSGRAIVFSTCVGLEFG